VSTVATAFSKTSLQVTTSVASAPPSTPSPTPPPAPPSAPASTSPSATSGNYRIVANGFRVLHETKDDVLSRDGHGDEVYGAFAMFHYDRPTSALRGQNLRRTMVIGERANEPNRIRGGTWTQNGGFRGGDVFPAVADPSKRYGVAPGDQSFPFLIWQGPLSDGQDALILIPTLWEFDGNSQGYDKWFSTEQQELPRIWSDPGRPRWRGRNSP
jgi:hypothetical protein